MVECPAAAGDQMRCCEGLHRSRTTLFSQCLDDWIDEGNPVRVIDAFVESIDFGELGVDGVGARRRGGQPIIPRSCSSSTAT
jgi:hypothetical protein